MLRGFYIEKELAYRFDGKTYNELSDFHKKMIDTIFGVVNCNSIIESWLCERHSKPDIYIKIDENIKYISIKSGSANTVHFESIRNLVLFLRSLGVSEKTQKIILYYHYGDGTLNGTGPRRYTYEEILPIMSKNLIIANRELNQKKIIRACIDRFVFTGRVGGKTADFLYCGDSDYGTLASRNDVYNFVLNKNCINIKSLHIGPMTIVPYLRDTKKVSKHKDKRRIVQIKWHYLPEDLRKIHELKTKHC